MKENLSYELNKIVLILLEKNNKQIFANLFENFGSVIKDIAYQENEEDQELRDVLFNSLNNEILRIWKSDLLKFSWRIKVKMIEFIPEFYLAE